MIKQINTYEEKIRQAEIVMSINQKKVEAYKRGIETIDKILRMPVKRLFWKFLLGIQDIGRIELEIKKFDFQESLYAVEIALDRQGKYMQEDKDMYAMFLKKRDEFTKEIEETDRFEEMVELLRTKIRQILAKNRTADVTRLQGILETCNKAQTLEEKLEIYETLKINHK